MLGSGNNTPLPLRLPVRGPRAAAPTPEQVIKQEQKMERREERLARFQSQICLWRCIRRYYQAAVVKLGGQVIACSFLPRPEVDWLLSQQGLQASSGCAREG